MKYSYKYVRESLPKNKSSVSSIWVKAVARPLSFPLTYLFANMGFSANFISVLSGLVSVAGCILLSVPDKTAVWAGIVCINLKIDDHYAVQLKQYVDRIITFYPIPDEAFYGVPTLLVPNGFDFDGIRIVKEKAVPEDIHIAAVSSMRIWHGYERMIEGLHQYYSGDGNRNIVLHLVGDGREGAKELCRI